MPTPISKTRQALKARFQQGASPAESDFSHLIDASLNQAEDGVIKLPDDPLSLVRQRPDQPVLRFFEDAVAGPSWQIQLAADGRPGLAFATPEGLARLFIDQATGHVGVGTTEPAAMLSVHRDHDAIDRSEDAQTKLTHRGQIAIKSPQPQLDFIDTNGVIDWAIHANEGHLYFIRSPWEISDFHLDGNTGNVGIGTHEPKHRLHVKGTAAIDSLQIENLLIAGKAFNLTSHELLNNQITAHANGNIGIGTTTPSSKLTICNDSAPIQTGKDPESRLYFGGELTVKGQSPQIDLIEIDSKTSWAIHVKNNAMYLVKSPWDCRVCLDGNTGYVGIGLNKPPAYALHVAGSAQFDFAGSSQTETISIGFGNAERFVWRGQSNDGWLRLVNANDTYDAGIAAREFWSETGTYERSDLRSKQASSIRPVINALKRVRELQAVQYYYKNDSQRTLPRLGFVAQDVEVVVPEAVAMGPNGLKGIQDTCLIALITQGMKELVQNVRDQQAQINSMQAHISDPLQHKAVSAC